MDSKALHTEFASKRYSAMCLLRSTPAAFRPVLTPVSTSTLRSAGVRERFTAGVAHPSAEISTLVTFGNRGPCELFVFNKDSSTEWSMASGDERNWMCLTLRAYSLKFSRSRHPEGYTQKKKVQSSQLHCMSCTRNAPMPDG